MSILQLNIAFQAPPALAEYALKVSPMIAAQTEAYFILNPQDRLPHVTVYQPFFPLEAISELEIVVAELASLAPAVELIPEELETHHGYISLLFKKTPSLLAFHRTVVERCNPLRQGVLRAEYQDPVQLAQFSPAQQKYALEYGYTEVLAEYNPHLTLSRVKSPAAAEALLPNLPRDYEPAKITHLGLYHMSDHGTCTDPIGLYPLGG